MTAAPGTAVATRRPETTDSDYVTFKGFHAALQSLMGNLAPAYETLRRWTRPSYLAKYPELAEITPRPHRPMIDRPFHRRRGDVERFARDFMADMRPARRPRHERAAPSAPAGVDRARERIARIGLSGRRSRTR